MNEQLRYLNNTVDMIKAGFREAKFIIDTLSRKGV